MVEKAGSNGGILVGFYACTTNKSFKVETALLQFLSNLSHSFTGLIVLCRLALTIPKPHQRKPFLATDPGAAHATSQEGRQRSATPAEMFAKGMVQLYCGWCSLRYHVPALSQAIHWRNRSKAFGSFRGRPSFSGGL